MKLKEWRLNRGYSLNQAAKLIDVSDGKTVQRYESGRMPRKQILQRIYEVTDGEVTADDFMDLPENDPTPCGAEPSPGEQTGAFA